MDLVGDINHISGTYDAYEKDIANALFYFEEPTVFEYTRHVHI